jgi:branched-chain amino acid transport system substrate-binding protein
MKKVILRLLVIICVVLACSSNVWAERPIRILALYPISGPVKTVAEEWLLGMKFAFEEVNAQGGLLGRKVELTIEDSQLKPDVAVAKAQKYLLEGNLDIVVGTVSNIVKALQDLTKQHNILFVMFSGSDEETGKNFTYNSVRLWWNTAMSARATVAYMAKYTRITKLYLINQDYSYGRDFAAGIKRDVARIMPGAQIIGDDYHPFASKDLSPFLTKIKASGAETIITSDWGLAISVLLKQRRELGVKATVLGPALGDVHVVREDPEAALGNISAASYFGGVKTKENTDFVNAWRKRFEGTGHGDPNNLSGREYIGMKFLFEAIKKAGSTQMNKLIPVMEGMHQMGVLGDTYMRACDHQLHFPSPIVSVTSKTPPYFSMLALIPTTAVEVPETEVDNPRCRKK